MHVIDVRAQHPTERFLAQPYFESLNRWTGQSLQSMPLELTAAARFGIGPPAAHRTYRSGFPGADVRHQLPIEDRSVPK